MTIGERIKAARLAKGWTQEKLAEVMKYSREMISLYERDVYQPSSRALMAFERVLGRLVK